MSYAILEQILRRAGGQPDLAEYEHTCNGEDGGDPECLGCGVRDCPHREPLHWHHDGCPACSSDPPSTGLA